MKPKRSHNRRKFSAILLMLDDEQARERLASEIVSRFLPREISISADDRFSGSISDLLRPSITPLKKLATFARDWMSTVYPDFNEDSTTRVKRDQDFVENVLVARLGFIGQAISLYCRLRKKKPEIEEEALACGHVLLQNEYLSTTGDDPNRSEFLLDREPLRIPLYRINDQIQAGIYRRWLHLVGEHYPDCSREIGRVWNAIRPVPEVRLLNEVDFPNDDQGQWRMYSFFREFACENQLPETIRLSALYHPAHRLSGERYALIRRRDNQVTDLKPLIAEVGIELDRIEWHRAATLADELSRAPENATRFVAGKFKYLHG
jgi:hypothetical protein